MLDPLNPYTLISRSTSGIFNLRISFLHLFLEGIYDYQAGYRIQIKLICRLTKDRALISISTKVPTSDEDKLTVDIFKDKMYPGHFHLGFIIRTKQKAKQLDFRSGQCENIFGYSFINIFQQTIYLNIWLKSLEN